MRVECEIDYTELEGDHGMVDGVTATCNQCGHCTESFGQSEASIKRCLALMREECPTQEANYYVEEKQ